MFKTLLVLLAIVLSLNPIAIANSTTFIGGDDEPSTIFFDLESCLSNAGVAGSAADYSEFVAEINNTSDCAALSVVGDHLYRDNPTVNMHSCAPGVDNSIAMCVGISESCDFESSIEKAIKFDIEVSPQDNMPATLSQLRFYENAPETFSWINGPTGANNYPTKYGIRIYVNGAIIFEEQDVATEQDWNEEVYIFAGIEAFTVSENTIFNFELIPYCPIGNGATVAAWDVDNIEIIAGCDPVEGGEITFSDGTEEVEICAGDGIPDPLDVILANNIGMNSQWVITDTTGTILGLPEAPPFDLEGAGGGVCLIWHLSYADGLTGAEVGNNAADLQGCYDLSNPLTVIRIGVNGGSISFDSPVDSISICAGDGIADPLEVFLEDNEGDNSAWVITDAQGQILALPDAPPFDLEGAGGGTCLIWHVSFADGLTGVEVGNNASDLMGCYDLSNPLTVIREEVEGGELTFENGETQIEICSGDGMADPLDVTLENNIGENSGWVITDTFGNILALPVAPPFDFDEAGPGVCLIWHISFSDGLEGAEVGNNATDLQGCFELSNSISVTRNEANGGLLTFTDSTTVISLCAGDGTPDPLEVELSDNAGDNSAWVITDTTGTILALPPSPPFDLDGAGPGVCLIWHLSFADGLVGAEVGNNASDLEGCFDLSNPLTVIREEANGGEISFADGTMSIEICSGDGIADPLEVDVTGNQGSNFAWVITDTDGEILGLPDMPPFDLEGAGGGTCLIWHLAFAAGLEGVEVGANANDLQGCFDLSNALTVNRIGVNGGELSLANGESQITICADDEEPDPIEVVLENEEGSNSSWIITDNIGIILALPDTMPFDFEGSGAGVCLIWNISYEDDVEGLELGLNANNIQGCHALSNPVTITRLIGEACDLILCDAEGGMIMLDDSTTSITICAGDSIPDPLDVLLDGNVGDSSIWLITNTDAEILAIAENPPFDLDDAGEGVCLIWHLAFNEGLMGLEVGNSVVNLVGCSDLSNAITVNRVTGEDCNGLNCDIEGGSLTFEDGSTSVTICAGDSIPDPLNVDLSGEIGTNSGWVITDLSGTILGLPTSPPFDLDDAGTGVCLIWHISYEDDLTGAEVGNNANDLDGCFDLSNAISVTRVSGPDCNNIGCDVEGGLLTTSNGETEIEICAGDSIPDIIDVLLMNASGDSTAWIITDVSANILALPDAPPFDLEGAGPGICLIWHLSYSDTITGLAIGENASQLEGCFDLSNQITVTRYEGANCQMIGCMAEGGNIMSTDSMSIIETCSGDGIDDLIDVTVSNNSASNSQWIITDANLTILDLPMAPPFNFEGAPSGACLIWHLAYEDGIEGLETGFNAGDLAGCFSLSNSITVIRREVNGGEIVFEGDTTSIEICVNDTMPDILDVFLSGAIGDSSIWVVTDTSGLILDLVDTSSFDFSNVPPGICLIWHLSYNGMIEGAEIGNSASDISGCFDLSNPLTVIRVEGEDCDDGFNDPEDEISFTIGPNPVSEQLYVQVKSMPFNNGNAMIFNGQGKMTYSNDITIRQSTLIDVSSYNSGIYFVIIQCGKKQEVKKFIILE